MESRFRLRENERFQRVRAEGRSWSHLLLVLCALPNGLEYSRFGLSVSKRVGRAVGRNRGARGRGRGADDLDMKSFVLVSIRLYRRWMSPALAPSCRFVPSCSQYAYQAIEKYGVIKGSWLGGRSEEH